MILGGDEMGRTQQGSNNAYCQDNEMSWFDWEHADQGLIEFTRRLIAFQHAHPVFRRRRWFKGQAHAEGTAADIAWFKPDGMEMTEQDWTDWSAKSFALFLNGDSLPGRDRQGRIVRDDRFCLLFNAHVDTVAFTLPGEPWGAQWTPVIDTALEEPFAEGGPAAAGGSIVERPALSLHVLRRA